MDKKPETVEGGDKAEPAKPANINIFSKARVITNVPAPSQVQTTLRKESATSLTMLPRHTITIPPEVTIRQACSVKSPLPNAQEMRQIPDVQIAAPSVKRRARLPKSMAERAAVSEAAKEAVKIIEETAAIQAAKSDAQIKHESPIKPPAQTLTFVPHAQTLRTTQPIRAAVSSLPATKFIKP